MKNIGGAVGIPNHTLGHVSTGSLLKSMGHIGTCHVVG